MKIISEFKEFISKGNVIDLAVGVVIGAGFGRLVDGVVKGIIDPIVAMTTGKGNSDALLLGISNLGSGVANFLILAAVVFFVFVKPMNKFREMEAAKKPAPPPPGPSQEALLAEIRDLLKKS